MLVERTEVELEIGGELGRAWLFTPGTRERQLPCIVMGHGFGLTRRCGMAPFAEAFAEAGHAVFLFDYRGFGDSEGEPRQLISVRRQLEDWRAWLAFARSRAEVDSARVVAWGFSLGGGHALMAASADVAVAKVVAVAPMFDGFRSTLAAARFWTPLTFLRIVVMGVADSLRALVGRSPVLIPVAADPGRFGMVTSPAAYSGYRAVAPPDFEYGLAARVALVFWSYVPGRQLRRFTRPILVLPSRIDKVNPPGPTVRFAQRCASASIVELECEHMDFAEEPHRSRIVRATLDFLG